MKLFQRLSFGNRKRQKGVAMTEAVIVTPFLCFMVIATAEVTNAFHEHNVLSKAVRNGARYAATMGTSGTTGVVALTPQLISDVQSLVAYGQVGGGTPVLNGFASGNVQVADMGNNVIRVTASYAYTGILGIPIPGLTLGADTNVAQTLSATVMMRTL